MLSARRSRYEQMIHSQSQQNGIILCEARNGEKELKQFSISYSMLAALASNWLHCICPTLNQIQGPVADGEVIYVLNVLLSIGDQNSDIIHLQ